MPYKDELRQHARLAILRFLEDAPKYTSNVSMITDLLHRVGIAYTRAEAATEIRWLAEQGLVAVEDHAGFIIATATVSGVEIAQGIAQHPEIQRPRPGA